MAASLVLCDRQALGGGLLHDVMRVSSQWHTSRLLQVLPNSCFSGQKGSRAGPPGKPWPPSSTCLAKRSP